MKKTLLLVMLVISAGILHSQTIRFTSGIPYTDGAPTHTPSAKGSRVAIDTTTWIVYQWNPTGSTWESTGSGISKWNATGAPGYTPEANMPTVVVNTANELYCG